MLKKLSKEVKLLLLGALLSRTAMFMSVPFLSIYLTNALAFTPMQAGIVVSINPLAVVCTRFFTGKISEQLSPKKLLTIIPFIWGTIYLSFFFTDSFPILGLLNGLNGFCYAIYEPNAKKVLAEYAGAASSLTVFNLRYAAMNVGALFGPVLGMLFDPRRSLLSYLILGGIYLLIGLVNNRLFGRDPSLTATKERETEELFQQRAKKGSAKNWQLFCLLLIGVCFSYFGYAQFHSTLAQYYGNAPQFENGVQHYSLTLMLSQGIVLCAQFMVVKLTAKASSFTLLIISNLLFAAYLLTVPYSEDNRCWVLMILLYSFGELLLGTRLDHAVSSLATKDSRSTLFALTELIKLGNMLGPIVGSYFITRFDYFNGPLIFSLLAGLTLIGSLFLLKARGLQLKNRR